MTEQLDAREMLERAERAATAGDLASAGELLRGAARLQEEELGPLHPDLANTLNNLAVVAEGTGSWSEAESLYRRAAAIAAAALPPDHPMVVESRQNLEDFCRAHGLSLDSPAAIAPTPETVRPAPIAVQARPVAPTPGRVTPSLRWVTTGAVVLAVAVLLMLRPWSTRDVPAPASKPEPAASEPAAASPAPVEQARPPAPAPAPRRDDGNVATRKPPAAGGVIVAGAQLCRTFSASGRSWRCDPVGQPATPGPIVFLTRVTSPRDATVVHRWYRGNTLRQSVMLEIEANATEGYRTYSRLTVEAGDWRLEVRGEDGKLLNEQRFTVR